MIDSFPPVLSLTAKFTTAEPQRLPPFLGSALHGALGRALYRTVCAFPKRERCPGCPLYARCAYPALFQTPTTAHEALRAAGIHDQAPRPLLVAPEPGWTRSSGKPFRLPESAEVPVRLTLVGRAADDLAVVVVALQALARRGLGVPQSDGDGGRRRAALRLRGVTTAAGAAVYDAASDTYTPAHPVRLKADEAPAETLVELVSPVRLKQSGRFANAITPALLCDALVRRANALSILFDCGDAAVSLEDVAPAASRIEAVASNLRRVHVTRYSATQQRRMEWPGLMGTLNWRGDALQQLWPLLRFGELVQVGKGTALGFGRYRLGGSWG